MSAILFEMFNFKREMAHCDWARWEKIRQADVEIATAAGTPPLPTYAYFSMLLPTTPINQRNALKRIAERFKDIVPLPLPTTRHSKPRIGYIGAKIAADHVSGLLFSHLFPHHNTEDFDIFVFATRESRDNENKQRILDAKGITFVSFEDNEDDKACAELIRGYGIDLLISNDGWNDSPRPGIVAYRPAFKQALWQGTATTSAAPWFDYVIVDRHIDNQEKGWRTEEAILMPDCYYIAGHVKNEKVPAIPSRTELGIPENIFLFSNLNALQKLNPDIWNDWMEILKACPNSGLMLFEGNPVGVESLKRKAKEAGVDPQRFYFVPKTDKWSHVARAGVADLFLDSYYYGAHTTLAESLWMDVPAITLAGNTMSSRVGVSMLYSVGLEDLIVETRNDYKELAKALYKQSQALALYQSILKREKHNSALFNMEQQASHIEEFVLTLRN